MDKYMSVITNFWVSLFMPILYCKKTIIFIFLRLHFDGLNLLKKKKIEDNKCNWVSISGGGDPLWNFENHIDWYKRFFEITEGINIELHTSMPNVDGVPYLFFERVVYHLHDFEQLKQ